ncbi:alpha/beta fold hydrolase [Streptomyces sp. NPDC054766]|uniref:alpha/beta fold hydrolase n=1 Tax=Streptomyces rhizosphaerihabitans TaxID=1266770 RepID=UPI0021C16433|nr:alpha/beta fold hydrolase [Streptomyces rhizosphaerihabitans]MCT9004132.1 alpha/beta fold hydrolase [Streptomyces rhizosphaerihabitans]
MERPIATQDGLRLWTETFGSRRDPAVLLVMGGTAPGIVWPDELCRLIAADGYFVVRYDHRDTGRSGKSDGEYDLSTLAADAADVIVGLGLGSAHVVGQSVGGMVAQLLALDRPELVRSLVLLSSSPDANGDVRLPPRTGLPGPRPPMLERAARLTACPPRGPEECLAAAVDGWRVLVGAAVPFDQAYWVDLVRRVMARGHEPDTSWRHTAALDRTPPLTGRIAALDVPTLVVHGEQDPVLPLEHGEELHRVIRRARLWRIAGMGHIFPPHWSSTIRSLVVDHLRRT